MKMAQLIFANKKTLILRADVHVQNKNVAQPYEVCTTPGVQCNIFHVWHYEQAAQHTALANGTVTLLPAFAILMQPLKSLPEPTLFQRVPKASETALFVSSGAGYRQRKWESTILRVESHLVVDDIGCHPMLTTCCMKKCFKSL